MTPHRHTYRLLRATTLSLPTYRGTYECFLMYQCVGCRRVDCYSVGISQALPLPTWAEVTAVAQWQVDHPALVRERVAGKT